MRKMQFGIIMRMKPPVESAMRIEKLFMGTRADLALQPLPSHTHWGFDDPIMQEPKIWLFRNSRGNGSKLTLSSC
jgi:hypothetical protein